MIHLPQYMPHMYETHHVHKLTIRQVQAITPPKASSLITAGSTLGPTKARVD